MARMPNKRVGFPYLGVLVGYLEEEGQVGVVKGVIQCQEGPMHPTF